MTQGVPQPGFKLSGLDPLFHSPVLTFHLPEAARLNPQLLREIAGIRASDPGLARSNRNGWHSRDELFQRPEPGLKQLCAMLLGATAEATARIAPDEDLMPFGLQYHGWINVNPPGAFNTPHDHPGWFWSGVYFVATPAPPPGADTSAGAIEFLDGRTNLLLPDQVDTPCMRSKMLYRPAAGTLLLFPSHLRHWVYPNAAASDRVSIAFNVRFTKRAAPAA